MNWMLATAKNDKVQTAVRVMTSVAHLGTATAKDVSKLTGISRGSVQNALGRLLIQGALTRDGDGYSVVGSHDSVTPSHENVTEATHENVTPHTESCDVAHENVCGTVDAPAGTGVTNYSLIPTVSSEVVDARTSTRETSANHEQVDAAPSAPSSGYPDRLNEVLEAWNGLTNSAGVSWWSFPRKDAERRRVINTLAGIVTEIGAQAALEGIDSLANRYSSNYPPQFRYIRERAEGAKADRARKASKDRGAYGGCDDLIGTTTDEEMAEARKLISPEESAEIARIRAEGRKRAIAHIAKLKAQGLMK